MKKLVSGIPIWLCAATLCVAVQQQILVVKIQDRAKELSYKIMTPEEYKAVQNQIKAESKFYRKALMLADKDWQADPANAGKRFPKSAISQRKAVVTGKFKNMEKAFDKIRHYDEQKTKNEERAEEREKERQQKRRAQFRQNKVALKRFEEKIEQDKKKAKDREAFRNTARFLFENKLAELMSPPATL